MAVNAGKKGLNAAVHELARGLSQAESDPRRQAEMYRELVMLIRHAVLSSGIVEPHAEPATAIQSLREQIGHLVCPTRVGRDDFERGLQGLIDRVEKGQLAVEWIEAPFEDRPLSPVVAPGPRRAAPPLRASARPVTPAAPAPAPATPPRSPAPPPSPVVARPLRGPSPAPSSASTSAPARPRTFILLENGSPEVQATAAKIVKTLSDYGVEGVCDSFYNPEGGQFTIFNFIPPAETPAGQINGIAWDLARALGGTESLDIEHRPPGDPWRVLIRVPNNLIVPAVVPALAPEESDPLYERVVELVATSQQASISWVQRRLGHLGVGYNRAAKMVDRMEREGIVGPSVGGVQPRAVLVGSDYRLTATVPLAVPAPAAPAAPAPARSDASEFPRSPIRAPSPAPESKPEPNPLAIVNAIDFNEQGQPLIKGKMNVATGLLNRFFPHRISMNDGTSEIPITFEPDGKTFQVTVPRKDATYTFTLYHKKLTGEDQSVYTVRKEVTIPAPPAPQINEAVGLDGRTVIITGTIPAFVPNHYSLFVLEKGTKNWKSTSIHPNGHFTFNAPRRNVTWVFCVADSSTKKVSPHIEKTVEVPPPPEPPKPQLEEEVTLEGSYIVFRGKIPDYVPGSYELLCGTSTGIFDLRSCVKPDGSFTARLLRPPLENKNLGYSFYILDDTKQIGKRAFSGYFDIQIDNEPELDEITPPTLNDPPFIFSDRVPNVAFITGRVFDKGYIRDKLSGNSKTHEIWFCDVNTGVWRQHTQFDEHDSFSCLVEPGTYKIVLLALHGGRSKPVLVKIPPQSAASTTPEINRPNELIIPGGAIPLGESKLKITGRIPNYQPNQKLFLENEEHFQTEIPVDAEGSFECEIDLIGRYNFCATSPVSISWPASTASILVKGRPEAKGSIMPRPSAPTFYKKDTPQGAKIFCDVPEPRKGKAVMIYEKRDGTYHRFWYLAEALTGVALELALDQAYTAQVITFADKKNQGLYSPLKSETVFFEPRKLGFQGQSE